MTRDEMFEILLSGAQRWANHLESCDNESVNKGHGKVYTLEIQMIDTAISEFRKAEEHRGQQTSVITPGLREPSLIPDEPRFLPEKITGTPKDRFKDTGSKHVSEDNSDSLPVDDALDLLEERINSAVAVREVQVRNKEGVRIHNVVERLKGSVAKEYPDVDAPQRIRLRQLTTRLLVELFGIPEKDLK